MIAKIITHNTCDALINYHEKKVKCDKAERLFSNTLSDNILDIKNELNDIVKENQNLRKNKFLHIALSFDKSDNLNNKEDIIREYINELGYSNTSYLVYEHFDTNHPHFHIVLPTVDYEGKKIEEYNNYFKNKKICRAIEQKYSLRVVEDKRKGKDISLNEINANKYLLYKCLTKALKNNLIKGHKEENLIDRLQNNYLKNNEVQKFIYDNFNNPDDVFVRLETLIIENKLNKEILKGKLNDLIDKAKDKSVEDKIKFFNENGIYARVMYDNKGQLGLVYGLNEESFYIRDYKLGKKFVYSNLDNISKKLNNFDKNKQKKFLKNVLKNNMVKASGIKEFEELCRIKGIEVIYNKAKTGNISGVSFRSVNVKEPVTFKGSELGFSFKYIQDYFNIKENYKKEKEHNQTKPNEKQNIIYTQSNEKPDIFTPLLSGSTKQSYYGEDEFDRMRKGKKKKKGKGI